MNNFIVNRLKIDTTVLIHTPVFRKRLIFCFVISFSSKVMRLYGVMSRLFRYLAVMVSFIGNYLVYNMNYKLYHINLEAELIAITFRIDNYNNFQSSSFFHTKFKILQ